MLPHFKLAAGHEPTPAVPEPQRSANRKMKNPASTETGFQASGGTRTHDLRITNALLYQLSHTSIYTIPNEPHQHIAYTDVFRVPIYYSTFPQKSQEELCKKNSEVKNCEK